MSLIPFLTQRLIPPGANDPRIVPRIGILHVDAMNAASLYNWFNGPSGGIESHVHIRLDGTGDQYRDTNWEADGNHLANPFSFVVETQGFGKGKWTAEQLQTIKRLMVWARREHGIPLRKVTSWNDPVGGWGFHTMWGAPSPWTPVVKSCPGPDRIEQFYSILVPWMESYDSKKEGFKLDDKDKAYLDNRFEQIEQRFNEVLERVENARIQDRDRYRWLRNRMKNQFKLTDEQLDRIEAELQ